MTVMVASVFVPTFDGVLIRPEKEGADTGLTEAGLYTPIRDTSATPKYGTVVAVGPGHWSQNGSRQPVAFGEGARVAYNRGAKGPEIVVDGERLLLLKERDIYGEIR